MVSLRHLPTRRMVAVLTYARRSIMALPARKDFALNIFHGSHLWADSADDGADGGCDFIVVHDVCESVLADCSKGSVARGAVLAKVNHVVMRGYCRTHLRVSGTTMPNRLPFGAVLMSSEEQDGKVCIGEGGGRGSGGVA